jgi:hypothetical protein
MGSLPLGFSAPVSISAMAWPPCTHGRYAITSAALPSAMAPRMRGRGSTRMVTRGVAVALMAANSASCDADMVRSSVEPGVSLSGASPIAMMTTSLAAASADTWVKLAGSAVVNVTCQDVCGGGGGGLQ